MVAQANLDSILSHLLIKEIHKSKMFYLHLVLLRKAQVIKEILVSLQVLRNHQ